MDLETPVKEIDRHLQLGARLGRQLPEEGFQLIAFAGAGTD
jgi:hypothetical protein